MSAIIVGLGHLGGILRAGIPEATLWPERMQSLDVEVLLHGAPQYGIPAGTTHVINAAGKTDLAWCEDHPREAWADNVVAPLRLLQAVLEVGARLIHLSSACLWDGPFRTGGRPFEWRTPPDPPSWYGWTKAACDSLLLDMGTREVAILRPRQPFSALKHPRNTITKLLAYEKLIDTPNSMTSVATILHTVKYLIADQDRKSDFWGRPVLVYDKGITTPYRVGVLLAEAGLRSPPQLLQKADLDTWHRPKRVDVVCEDEIFESEIDPPRVEDALRETIEGYRLNSA